MFIKHYPKSLNPAPLGGVADCSNLEYTSGNVIDGRRPCLPDADGLTDTSFTPTRVFGWQFRQYLNLDSHHPLIHKLGVVRTLYERSDNRVTDAIYMT